MKTFDCFKFFNEFELLDLRLMELDSVVDYFVIVEANKTHTGKDKPYLFDENCQQFSKYFHKIIHVKVGNMPEYSTNDIWKTENYQRNCIMSGLKNNAQIGDKIIVSDVDEIPKAEVIEKYKNQDKWITFNQRLYYYYVNCEQNSRWNGPIMAAYGSFTSTQQLRNIARKGLNVVEDAGWHYSFMGGAERIRTKVESIAESHLIIDNVGNVDDIQKKMLSQKDLWNRTDKFAEKKIVDISDDKPKSMDVFLQKYPHFFYNGETK
jgi:beta-1,4-mannosyl-glycoprotein beta-1,4-N-acetylglucosaminyltransferase